MAAPGISRALLQTFVPLNALSAQRLDYLLEGQGIESLPAGTEICRRGESDGHTIFLLSGAVTQEDETGTIQLLDAGDIDASHALAPDQPRTLTVRAKTAVNIMRFESKRLDRVLAWDQATETLQRELVALQPGESNNWISRLLQSRLFYRLPPSNIVELFRRLTPESVSKGQVVIKQGTSSDCCYFIKTGTAEVRLSSEKGPVTLAVLQSGQYFGEDGLLMEGTRNADVVMQSDGVVMRLDKKDFDELLKAPSLALMHFSEAVSAVASGEYEWLDVRLMDEQAKGILTGALRLPLQALRTKAHMLPTNKHYVVYCDTGRRSTAAAFLLGVMGYDAHVLEGGLSALMPSERSRFLVVG
ncbi:MAG: cyclic nucleotide-binding domain-containing protein [Moraxellaceae bacterium]|jgi:CRP-like cAMP-binding protein|nr:cyclic nucleotide-binding domain-containing protein [Moraxellaceae bacterium]MBP8852955.1 cyclic nucleotide-binding domain-containing protein [Moraxellaceae bacterium]MBP9046378.1 cyclic nucleotide-binding domain-containing protein [Moraxellaceae bacterium]MBP9731625.1 cyclic nucleotide-binding domain-containing protein [Moraxellaceae bacterium]MCC6200346.1 cyclic nucleotide-binding domain-containing protein [Moraxellaceae bacterium]